ncbi:type II secretion system major pseudopilin GspG [Ruixingdingia sedimenti]|uniref:Type II secretion system core protein G n=1 Tax=Ruixingdingia sedimenti TaxID=3073604 RepID=A0ABU1F5R7_9RHOB|nr:type II secretion system major pseudopilin GspG [Xinfangfangia sp. LG-4]MDR5651958.1 type II secretion system major pseudopilin GspG [Xinfangfangia sp. LG-4]
MTTADTAADRPRTGRHDEGFSLLELMVVVVILSILAIAIVPRIIDRPDQARVARARSDIAVLESALQLYRLDNLGYPTTEQGLRALVEKPTRPPLPPNWAGAGYVQSLPKDPWGADYQYLYPGLRGEFDVFSYGADGKPGGEGVNRDIGSWSDE